MTTPERERERMARVYSGKRDEELQEIALDRDQLSEAAREALEAEFSRRGVKMMAPQPDTEKGEDVVELSRTVLLRRFRDLPEALLAKGSLESAGIECYLVDENMVRMDWFISNLLGGVKLCVLPEDLEAAEAILSQPIPENLNIEGVGEYEQPRCPKCQSLDVSYREVDKISYGFAFVGFPLPLHKKAWTCHACKAEWEEASETAGEPQI